MMTRQVDVKALISHIVRGDGADKCRICMGDTSEGQVYLGDTVMMDGDRSVSLSELLELITGVEVDVPELPESVCASCMNHVSAAKPLIKLAWASSRKLREVTDFLCNVEHPTQLNESNITKHFYLVFDEDGPKSYIDKIESSIFPPTTGKNILISPPTSKKEVLTNFKSILQMCAPMPETLMKIRSIEKEDWLIKTKVEGSINTNETHSNTKYNVKYDGPYVCPECTCDFSESNTFTRHVRILNVKPCYICKYIFPLKALADHIFKEHGIEILSCHICSDTFHMDTSFESHMKKYHDASLQFCSICKRSYPSLAQHSVIHRPHMCSGCQRSFTNFSCYKKHPCTSPALKPPPSFICNICKKPYNSSSALRSHKKFQHMGAKLLKCKKCGGLFVNSRVLLKHKRANCEPPRKEQQEGQLKYTCICGLKFCYERTYIKHYKHAHVEKKYVCTECSERFGTTFGLERHLRTVHTPKICSGCNEKFKNSQFFKMHLCSNPTPKADIFCCDICSAEYNTKNILRNHIIREHLFGKRFQCDKCGKKFANRVALAEHNNTHEKVKDRYVCSICHMKYSTRRGYSEHYKRKHLGVVETKPKKPRKKIYACSFCDYKSAAKKAIPRHIIRKHKSAEKETIKTEH